MKNTSTKPQKAEEGRQRVCQYSNCGKKFTVPYPSKIKKFCSKRCRMRYANEHRTHTLPKQSWKIEELADKGYTLDQIAKLTGFHRNSISRHFSKTIGFKERFGSNRVFRLSVSKTLASVVTEIPAPFVADIEDVIMRFIREFNAEHPHNPAVIRVVLPKNKAKGF